MTERKTKTPAGAEVKEIIWIDLTRTNNGAHYQFIKNVHENISAETELLTDTRIKAAADKLGEALKKEDDCYARSKKSFATDEIVAADALRDKYFQGMRKTVKGLLNHPDADTALAAQHIEQYIKDHRVDSDMQLERETGAITNLIGDCETKGLADVNKLNIKPYVDALKAANTKVDTLLMGRNRERVGTEAGALRVARQASDDAYLWLVKLVNALALTGDQSKFGSFIDLMNVVVKRYKEQVIPSQKKKDDPTDPKQPKEPKQPKDPKDPKQPKEPKEPKKPDGEKPKDPKKPDEGGKKPEKPGGGDGDPDIHLPEE